MKLTESPTVASLKSLLANADDNAGHHVLWVAHDSSVHLTQLPEGTSPAYWAERNEDLKFRLETFQVGNDYVGQRAAADAGHVSRLLSTLREGWKEDRQGLFDGLF